MRSVADFRNLQERTARETKAAKDFAIQRFARDLVESVDNLDRALSTVAPDPSDAVGFSTYLARYRAGLAIESAAVDSL